MVPEMVKWLRNLSFRSFPKLPKKQQPQGFSNLFLISMGLVNLISPTMEVKNDRRIINFVSFHPTNIT